MNKISLDALGHELLERARQAAAGRVAETVIGGHEAALRQTLIAMRAGVELSEHESPGEATVLVLDGRVRLLAGADTWTGRNGDLIIVPNERHRLAADADSVVLLTTNMRH